MAPGVIGWPRNTNEICGQQGIGNINEVIAGGTLNLSAGELDVALQVLFAVRAGEFEFVCHYDLLNSSCARLLQLTRRQRLLSRLLSGFLHVPQTPEQINQRRIIDHRRLQVPEQCSLWH